MSDMVTDDFNRRCGDGDTDLLHSTHAAGAFLPPAHREYRGKSLLARPLFVPEDEIVSFAGQLRSLFDLLATLPARVYEGDLSLYCQAVGIDKTRARYVRRFADRAPTLFGRADSYQADGSFKLLEFNVCSAVGGMDAFELPRALLRVPAFREFAEEHRLDYTDSAALLAEALHDAAAPITDGDTPRVALLSPDGELDDHAFTLLPYAEMLKRSGIEVVTGEVSAITERGGRLHLNGERVDVVMRFLSDSEMVTASQNGPAVETILRAHEERRAVLWTGLENQRINNKGALALLADDSFRVALTTDEAELVDRVLPWTRRLAQTQTRIGDDMVDLIDHCRSRRENLLLKPSFGHSGSGIVAGWKTDDATWATHLDDGVKDSWIVQERVVPSPEPVIDPDSGAVHNWIGAWGSFFTPAGYAGLYIRAVPEDSPDPVIRRMASGACTTGVFHYPATDGASSS